MDNTKRRGRPKGSKNKKKHNKHVIPIVEITGEENNYELLCKVREAARLNEIYDTWRHMMWIIYASDFSIDNAEQLLKDYIIIERKE